MQTPTSAPRSNSSVSTTPIRRIDSADELDSINLRRELFRTRNRLKEAQRELSSQNSLTKHLSTNNLLSSDALISDLRKDISEMGWEIKTLQKSKETLKNEVEKLEREIVVLESQKKSVEDANAMITRENKELRATIEELNDQNRIVLQNYQNHVKNYAIHEGLMSKLYDSIAQIEKENSQLKEKCVFLEEKLELKQISLVDKNELEKLNSSNRVLTLQYDYEVAKREHCERQLARLQDNIKQLQSELSYMDEKVKRADDQMKLADRLNRDNKDECEILQLKIMDLEKRLNLTEKDKDIVEQELLIVKQKMEATTYRIQRYNEALVNADNDMEQMSDTSYSEDVASINGTETISLKSRPSHPLQTQNIMISRFLFKSTSILCRSCQQRLTTCSNSPYLYQTRRNLSSLFSKTLPHTSFNARRFLSKSTKTNKKYQPVSYGPKSKRPVIEVYHKMTIKALAQAMSINVDHIYDCLIHIKNGDQYSSDNQEIDDFNIIVEVVHLCGGKHRLIPSPFANDKKKPVTNVVKFVRTPMPSLDKLKPRPPVVTIMGHVDHGKTSLLDALRNSNIVSGEFGGITQHIGAFIVPVSKSMTITFIDTPGHLAFAEMRARGAQVTDIVVLVVAADDGVMPQTLESIAHANKAKVPIVVAINKIDKSDSNIKRTESMLAEHGVQLESIGGDVVGVPISALKNINIDKLLESILAVAELQQLHGDPNGPVEGTILESKHEEDTMGDDNTFDNNQRKG
ncbi:unnamed protein product [Adineta ricciae]|uniref:Tr-type G domain-containing protein n=1 Tax=Adineta ricciae TaxID=249248 RepID=A0A816ENV0_ADIRI|nr:unnamed protein product [Adineta ricciae]